jgi:hypothetical protein
MSKIGVACVRMTLAMTCLLSAPVLVWAEAVINERTAVDLKLLVVVLSAVVGCTWYLGSKFEQQKSMLERLRTGDEKFLDHEKRIRWLELNCASNHNTQRVEVE